MLNLPALLTEMGIDEAEIAQRQAFLSFSEQDAMLLGAVHGMLETKRDYLTETFYDHLLRFPEIRPLLGDEVKLARLKQAQTVYFSQLTAGCYDLAYVENRLHIGVVHQRVGLTPKWYMSAYCKYLSEVMPLVADYYAEEPERGRDTSRALLKVIFFDIGLALDTYFHAEQKALLLARSYTEQIVSNMPIGFIVLDTSQKIRLANNAVLRIFNLPQSEALQDKTLGEFLDVAALDEQVIQVLKSRSHCNDFGFDRTNKEGVHSYLADISLAQIGEETLVLFMVQDITIRKQSEEEIHRLAFYDPLTKLPNRRLLH
ncbi:MAG: protoglobin domain-containing protein, partial [Sideroxyarcus sp.]|nr:protoglobin domain-containing protein [Sideroxyarcus sp.]